VVIWENSLSSTNEAMLRFCHDGWSASHLLEIKARRASTGGTVTFYPSD